MRSGVRLVDRFSAAGSGLVDEADLVPSLKGDVRVSQTREPDDWVSPTVIFDVDHISMESRRGCPVVVRDPVADIP